MDFTGFGWRDIFLLALVLAAVYLVVGLLGLARLRRRREQLPFSEVPQEPLGPVGPPTEPLGKGTDAAHGATEPVAADVLPSPPSPFAAHLALSELEVDVRRLRADVSALREELAELKAVRRVSPLYADAAALAKRGFDARGVASECGISVAEAELVMAMSRDDKDFENEVDDGEPGRRAAAGSPGQ